MINDFLNAMAARGIICNIPIVPDGAIHRFASGGIGQPNCWCVWYGTRGSFGCWKRGVKFNWPSKKQQNLSVQERIDLQRQIEQSKRDFDNKLRLKHDQASELATKGWEGYSLNGHSDYLEAKMIKPNGARFGNGFIVISLYGLDGKLCSLQRIYDQKTPDGKYHKCFMKNGRVKGCFYLIGKPIEEVDTICVCEGFATGATIFQGTNLTTLVAFNSGNLSPVIASIRAKYPNMEIIIAGDDDIFREDGTNPGRKAALEAARTYNCRVAFPDFSCIPESILYQYKPSDFNDAYVLKAKFGLGVHYLNLLTHYTKGGCQL
jgi:putative DNA primase/helicase